MTSQMVIHYCPPCGLRPTAVNLAVAVEAATGVTSEIRPGGWGTFRIEYAGNVLFDRWKTRGLLGRIGFGRLPTAEELVALVKQRGTVGVT